MRTHGLGMSVGLGTDMLKFFVGAVAEPAPGYQNLNLLFQRSNLHPAGASLQREKINQQEQSGILAQIVLSFWEKFGKDFSNFTIQIAIRNVCQVATL
jgi:hypothetical protein